MNDDINIAVVDDHAIFRCGVVQLLDSQPGFHVVGEGESAGDAVRLVETLDPDVVLLDIKMPGGGIEAARVISGIAPQTLIIMLTLLDDDRLIEEARLAGARLYALKGISGRALVSEIQRLQHDDVPSLDSEFAIRFVAC